MLDSAGYFDGEDCLRLMREGGEGGSRGRDGERKREGERKAGGSEGKEEE